MREGCELSRRRANSSLLFHTHLTVCIAMFVYPCMCVYICMWIYACIVNTLLLYRMLLSACVCVCVCVRVYAYIHTYIHTYMHAYNWCHIQRRLSCANLEHNRRSFRTPPDHPHARIHTYIHMNTNIHTHEYIQ